MKHAKAIACQITLSLLFTDELQLVILVFHIETDWQSCCWG